MAHRAARGQAQPDRAGGFHPVPGIQHKVFLSDRPAFVGGDVAAVEAGGDLLFQGAVREEIARNLFNGELVERLVAVEGFGDVLPVGPHLAVVVEMDPVRVGVTRIIQPITGAVLAPGRRGQQAVHQLLIGLWIRVLEESLYHGRFGRQARQVQTGAADQGAAVRFRGGFQLIGLKGGEDKLIDRIFDGGRVSHRGQGRADWGDEGPMGFVFRALVDPTLQGRDLLRLQGLVRLRGRHDFIGIFGKRPLDHFAHFRFAGHQGNHAVLVGGRCRFE